MWSLSQEPGLRTGGTLVHKDLSWCLMNCGEGQKQIFLPPPTESLQSQGTVIALNGLENEYFQTPYFHLKFVERNTDMILDIKLIWGSTGISGLLSYLYSAFDVMRHRKI